MPPSRSSINLRPMGIPHATGPENVVPPKHIGVSEESPKHLVGIELVFEEIARRGRRRRSSPPPPESVHLAVVEIIDASGLVVHPSRTVVAQTLESLRDLLERVFRAWRFVLIGMNLQRELPIRFPYLFDGATLLQSKNRVVVALSFDFPNQLNVLLRVTHLTPLPVQTLAPRRSVGVRRGMSGSCGGLRIEALALLEQRLNRQIAVEPLSDFDEFDGAVFVPRRDCFLGDPNAAQCFVLVPFHGGNSYFPN